MFNIPSFLLTQDATIEVYLGQNAYEDLFTGSTAIKCRFEPLVQKVIDSNGNEVVSTGRMFIGPGINITAQSKVYFEDQQYIVISLAKQQTISSYSHKEVLLK
jgi:hypothetical protein